MSGVLDRQLGEAPCHTDQHQVASIISQRRRMPKRTMRSSMPACSVLMCAPDFSISALISNSPRPPPERPRSSRRGSPRAPSRWQARPLRLIDITARMNTTFSPFMLCKADSGSNSATDFCATVIRALTAEPGPTHRRYRSWRGQRALAGSRHARQHAFERGFTCLPSLMRVTITGTPGLMCWASAPKCADRPIVAKGRRARTGACFHCRVANCSMARGDHPEIGAAML